MPEVRFGRTTIHFNVKKSDQRETVGIAVDPKDGVIVTVPEGVTDDKINEIVKKRAGWIIEKQEEIKEINGPPLEKEFLSGEKLPYLGRRYRLKLINNDNTGYNVVLKYGKFSVKIPTDLNGSEQRKMVRDNLLQWYYEHAESKLKERVKRYKHQVGVEPNSVKVKHQQKRWGSCTKNKELLYNWRIIMAPMSIVDYIVVHELCHLKEKNHTDRFWRMVKSVIPDYQDRKEWLRVNGPSLVF